MPSEGGRAGVPLVVLNGGDALVERIEQAVPCVRVLKGEWPHPCSGTIIVAMRLTDPAVWKYLDEFPTRVPATPVILVTSGNPSNLAELYRIRVDALVRHTEIETDLASTVERITRRDLLEELAVAVENATWLGDTCAALPRVLRAAPPLRSENKLASEMEWETHRVWDVSHELRERTGYGLLDVMHVVALFRLALLVVAGLDLEEARGKLNLTRKSTKHWTETYFDIHPKKLARDPGRIETWLRAFVRDLLQRRGRDPREIGRRIREIGRFQGCPGFEVGQPCPWMNPNQAGMKRAGRAPRQMATRSRMAVPWPFHANRTTRCAIVAAAVSGFLANGCDTTVRSSQRREQAQVASDSAGDLTRVRESVSRCRSQPTCEGVIYVWSPLMPLSAKGIDEVVELATDPGLQIMILRGGVLSEALGKGDANGAAGSELTLIREIVESGGTIHYPAIIRYDSSGIHGNAILGYKTAAAYRQILLDPPASSALEDALPMANGTATEIGAEVSSASASGGSEQGVLEVDGEPGPYFRWVPGTKSVAYEAGRVVHLLNITDGTDLRAPGYIDFVPSPDGRIFVTPGSNRSGLEFYDAQQVFAAAKQGKGKEVEPVFVDRLMRDQYPSVGILSEEGDGSRTTYRVLTSWYDKVIFRDYEVRRHANEVSVRPVGRPTPACTNYQVSLPMMSQDGRQLAARDEATASTKIFRLNDDGTCEEDFDLGLQTGKVAWQAGGRRIAFAIPRGVVQDGSGVLWRADDDDRELAGIFMYHRDEIRLTRVFGSEDVSRLAFPEWVGQDTVMFLISPSQPGEKSRFRMVWPVR